MLPVGVQEPTGGSYSSAVASAPALFVPPVTSTLPLVKSVAVWLERGVPMSAVGVHASAAAAAGAVNRTKNAASPARIRTTRFFAAAPPDTGAPSKAG